MALFLILTNNLSKISKDNILDIIIPFTDDGGLLLRIMILSPLGCTSLPHKILLKDIFY